MTEKITFHLNKLVRDGAYDDMITMGQEVDDVTLEGEEKQKELLGKIIEEAKELRDGDDVNPADLGSSFFAYLKETGCTVDELSRVVQELEERRGGFDGGHFVRTVTLSPDDTWVEYYRKDPDKYPEESS